MGVKSEGSRVHVPKALHENVRTITTCRLDARGPPGVEDERVPREVEMGTRQNEKEQRTCVRCSLAMHPSPRYFAQKANSASLVQRAEDQNARFGIRTYACRIDTYDCILLSAECADARLVEDHRPRQNRVADDDARSNGACARGK